MKNRQLAADYVEHRIEHEKVTVAKIKTTIYRANRLANQATMCNTNYLNSNYFNTTLFRPKCLKKRPQTVLTVNPQTHAFPR